MNAYIPAPCLQAVLNDCNGFLSILWLSTSIFPMLHARPVEIISPSRKSKTDERVFTEVGQFVARVQTMALIVYGGHQHVVHFHILVIELVPAPLCK